MLYRVVLIFVDTKSLADFIEQVEEPGEFDGSIYTFAGTLNEEQIAIARKSFGAYMRLLRVVKKR
jgi:hypothetical protein